MGQANFLVAFGAGVLSFFSPCVIPLLPVYLAYLGGSSSQAVDRSGRWRFLLGILIFVLSLSFVLFVEGFLAGTLGFLLFKFKRELEIVFGVLIFLLGLLLSGLIPLPWLYKERGLTLGRSARVSPLLSGLILGLAFSLTWTPCSGPVLASILALAASSGVPLLGGFLLLVYSLGFSLPFLLIAFFFSGAAKYISSRGRLLRALQIFSGFLFMALGILLALGKFSSIFF
jgi:cytochrome c biogenesis protein CcdA